MSTEAVVCAICGQAHLDFAGQDIEAFRLKAVAHGWIEDPPLTFSSSDAHLPVKFTIDGGRIAGAEYVWPSAEQQARDLLERMEVPGAQAMSAGDLVELANLIADANAYRRQWK